MQTQYYLHSILAAALMLGGNLFAEENCENNMDCSSSASGDCWDPDPNYVAACAPNCGVSDDSDLFCAISNKNYKPCKPPPEGAQAAGCIPNGGGHRVCGTEAKMECIKNVATERCEVEMVSTGNSCVDDCKPK